MNVRSWLRLGGVVVSIHLLAMTLLTATVIVAAELIFGPSDPSLMMFREWMLTWVFFAYPPTLVGILRSFATPNDLLLVGLAYVIAAGVVIGVLRVRGCRVADLVSLPGS